MDELFGGNKVANPNKPSEIRRDRRKAKERALRLEESQRKSVPRSPGPLSRKKQAQKKQEIYTIVPTKADTFADLQRKKEKLLKLIAWMGDMNERDSGFYKSILDFEFLRLLTDLVKKFDLTEDELKSVLPKGKDYQPLMNVRMSNGHSILVYLPTPVGNLISKYLYGVYKHEENVGWNTLAVDEHNKVIEPVPPPVPPIKPPSPVPPIKPPSEPYDDLQSRRVSTRLSPAKSTRFSPVKSIRVSPVKSIRVSPVKSIRVSPVKSSSVSPVKSSVSLHLTPKSVSTVKRSSPKQSSAPTVATPVLRATTPVAAHIEHATTPVASHVHRPATPKKSNVSSNSKLLKSLGLSPQTRIPKQYKAPTKSSRFFYTFNKPNAEAPIIVPKAETAKKPWSIFNVLTKKSDKSKKKGWFYGGRTRRSNRR